MGNSNRKWGTLKRLFVLIAFITIGLFLLFAWVFVVRSDEPHTIEQSVKQQVQFEASVSESERARIVEKLVAQNVDTTQPAIIGARWSNAQAPTFLDAYVFVTGAYSIQQYITDKDMPKKIYVDPEMEPELLTSLTEIIGVEQQAIEQLPIDLEDIDEQVVIIHIDDVTPQTKVLRFNNSYYLDDFSSGALFRNMDVSGEDAIALSSVVFEPLNENNVLKVNMTGVTALTRQMQIKLDEVEDPLFFSKNIGQFLADADLTHTSNEVSFADSCSYSRTLFCSPPEFIETLKASGVDLVEITGNHNNDLGADLNTATIKQYRELGWGVVGGGLNTEDARKPFIKTQDGSTVAFLAYNFPDSPNGAAIAREQSAGANVFDFENIEEDIALAKAESDSVVVSVQYWECYAYPNGYIEYPKCDKPIGEQEANFKKIIDLGADMVVGTSAHQPQSWEFYKGKPIYYGLGNMYFDQTQWPGTERGVVLTNYYLDGLYVQTKMTPTVYNKDFQPRVMNDKESEFLLTRLNDAR